MRRPTISEAVVQTILFAALLFALWDTISAFNGVVCRDFAELDTGACYPWGWEGPFAEFWFYRSREAYLSAGLLRIALLSIAFALPFFLRRKWLGILAMLVLLICAYPALMWVPHFLGAR
jgi:hypothetical protein